MKYWKKSGTFLAATGALHCAIAFLSGGIVYRDIFFPCPLNTVGTDPRKEFYLWFLLIGVLLILWGSTLQYYIHKEQRPAPRFLGYALMALSVLGCIVLPVSGFWLFIPQAAIILLAKRK